MPTIQKKTALEIAMGWRGPAGEPIDLFIESGGYVTSDEHREILEIAVSSLTLKASPKQRLRLQKLIRYINNSEWSGDQLDVAPRR